MNKTYKTVFNYHTQTWTAVSEIASARGKSKKNHLKLSVAIASSLLGLVSMNAYADTTLTCTTSATDTTGNVICGNSAAANAASAISIGSSANAVTRNSIAIGNSSNTAVTTAVTYTSVVANEPTASADSVAGVSNIAIGNHSQTAVFTATAGVRNAGSVAIGNYAYAAPTSVAIGPEAVAAGNTWDGIDENGSATAVGYKAYAVGKTGQAQGGTAIGARTLASGPSSVALGGASDGNGAKALGAYSTALGWNTNTVGDSAVAVGASARTGAANAIAIGKGAQATAAQSISIGTGNIVSGANAGAIGDPSYVSGAGTYTIGNNNGTSAAPIAATNSGAFGNNNALPTASTDGIRVVGNSNTVNSSNVMVMGNSVTVGAGLDGAVVLGNASTVSAAVDTASATVNGLTYSGFAGSAPADGDVMSVGSVSAPRQIQNVAAGRIAADSLDAINGSELYMTNNILGNVASSTAAILGGNAAVGTDGTLTMSDVGGTGEETVHDAIKAVNAVANKGWNLQTNGDTADKVAPGDTVQLLDGKNIKVTRSGKDVT
ncbi:MAG: ESPR-type extended signal peptide-containing protein, partial [Burkholderiaceae bacterium]